MGNLSWPGDAYISALLPGSLNWVNIGLDYCCLLSNTLFGLWKKSLEKVIDIETLLCHWREISLEGNKWTQLIQIYYLRGNFFQVLEKPIIELIFIQETVFAINTAKS